MISRIDITAYYLTEICEDILSTLAHRIETVNIYELVKECIISNKEQTGLNGFWIEDTINCRPMKFWVEFHFKDEVNSYRVSFSNMDSASGLYHVTDVSPYLIVTRPIRLKLDGLMYCSPCQRILYVDYFTEWVPLDDEDKNLSVHELIEGGRNDIDITKKDCFISFYERVSECEKQELRIANIDFWNLDDKEGDNYKYLLNRIYDEVISCVVVSDTHYYEILKSILPSYISLILCKDFVPSLSRQQWLFRAVTQIKQLLTIEQHTPKYRSKVYWRWLSVLIKYYNIPKCMLHVACDQLLTSEEFLFINKYGYL